MFRKALQQKVSLSYIFLATLTTKSPNFAKIDELV